ncbi:meckelin-like [Protopterus annectens]|uniref:meckelin-like n=1 Tax=Protopterus annectens TaxID=7888 RepID=UPI001CFC3A6E|nr:meckelin-like [Protopterus annectens]
MATRTLKLSFVNILMSVLMKDFYCQQFFIPYQKVVSCELQQYFDISSLVCKPCGVNQHKSASGTSCICDQGYRFISNNGGPSVFCQACPADMVVTEDGWDCIKCPSGKLTTEKTCRCDEGSILVERNATGDLLKTAECLKCSVREPSFTVPNTSGNRCVRCQETFINASGSCHCNSQSSTQVSIFKLLGEAI